MNAVEKHPQRAQIIEAIVRGESMRKIAEKLKPPIHQSSIARFRIQMLGTAVRTMKGTNANTKALRDLAAVSAGISNAENALDDSKERLRHELDSAVQADRKRLERWISDAEASQSVDPETGEVSHDMDHRALASHFSNSLKTVELRAKLHGLLQEGANNAGSLTNNILLLMPRNDQAGTTIDITPGRVDTSQSADE